MATISNETLITHFLSALAAERGVSENTLIGYKNDLMALDDSMAVSFVVMTADDIRRSVQKFHAEGLAARTVSRRLSAVRQFAGWMVSDQIRLDNPSLFLDNPKLPDPLPKSLNEADVSSLISACSKLEPPYDLLMQAGLELMYSAGLRISELLSLRLQDFVADKDMLLIRGKGGRERMVPLTSIAIATARRWRDARDADGPDAETNQLLAYRSQEMTRQKFSLLLKQIARHADIDERKVSAHVLRHSFATHLLNRGADLRSLQMLLGHADIATTQIYTRTRQDRLAGLVGDAHPLAESDRKE
ncbi:MAG: tyrosine recombinase [Alphaproteobacteria bacterium]|nr:tyrosine recombinase [Alphaproteobacteria bacterium]